jgi:ribokinase
MPKQIIVVGSYVQDNAWRVAEFPIPGETCRALGFQAGPGGKGFNQAIACSRQGANTLFIGAIGEDHLALSAEKFAADENLHAIWLKHPQHPTAAASILVNAHGENMIAVSLGANHFLTTDFLNSQHAFFENAGIVLCQLETNLDAIALTFKLAKQHGALCVLNPAPIHPDLELNLLQAADILTPNESEFALLCHSFTDKAIQASDVAACDEHILHQLCRRLSPNTVVITLGRLGFFVSHGEDRRGDQYTHYRVEAELVNAIDTTGAGDAFSGGLVAAMQLFPTQSFRQQANYASQVAALSTEKLGAARAMPTQAQLIARFR